jgi:HD-like signal output (HDOD) protein
MLFSDIQGIRIILTIRNLKRKLMQVDDSQRHNCALNSALLNPKEVCDNDFVATNNNAAKQSF